MASSGISIWVVAVDQEQHELWPAIFAILDSTERAGAERFRFQRHRQEYAAAHALKRLMLSAFRELPTSAWKFDAGPHGKPFLRSIPGLHFNLSHCDGLVACALSNTVEIGVDVERVTAGAPVQLARRYFAPEEEQWLNRLPQPARPLGFFRLWTLKEAFIKATGDGLSQPLHDFAFGFSPLHVSFRNPALGDERLWRFVQHTVGDEHLLSLAWRGGGAQMSVSIEQVWLEKLLRRDSRHLRLASIGASSQQ